MRVNPLLYDFRVQMPSLYAPQQYVLKWIATAHSKAEETASGKRQEESQPRMERRVRRFGCSPENIGFRASELHDFQRSSWEEMTIFNLHESPRGKSLGARNQFFADTVSRVVDRFYKDEGETPPADLVHVTCTGYASPSAIQQLVSRNGWGELTRTTQIYHMGCYASIPALRVTAGLLLAPQKEGVSRADIIHTELCSLHFNPIDHSPEQFVVQSLFADGHIRYSMSIGEEAQAAIDKPALEILAVREETVPDSLEDMTWALSEFGFRMTLSREVPNKVAARLPDFLVRLFNQAGKNYEDSKEAAIFAVHPGGPRIIESVEELLDLRSDQTAASHALLFERGNMSSATLPHIWARIVEDADVQTGTLIVSLGFGPGLTIAGALFRKR
ncbi:MAG TPA: 3-oxoacyl-[acyl-carrier-protein] synthase III C-terminal domain-containing protein [Blastocatellia bacterium]